MSEEGAQSEGEKGSPAMTPQQRRFSERKGALHLYRELMVGRSSWFTLLSFELVQMFFGNMYGACGLGARALLYPRFMRACGPKLALGRGVTVRVPRSLSCGAGVIIDDFATLDVRGAGGGISLGDRATIGRFTTVVAKEGVIEIGPAVNISSCCRIATQSRVTIGESTLIAAYTYIGPGNHQRGEHQKPLIEREMEIRGGVNIGRHCWIGAHSTIMDGVTLGDNVIVGAHSLVRDSVPANTTVAGIPARPIGSK